MDFRTTQVRHFGSIPASPKMSLVLTRLGYKKDVTILGNEDKERVERYIKQALLLCETKGVYGRYKITAKDEHSIRLDNGLELTSICLAEFLRNSTEAVFMSCTLGREITDRIALEINSKDAAFGVIMDAVASQTTDAGLDWLMEFINKLLKQEAMILTKRRYSPGYGDLELSAQKLIFDVLKLEELGLTLTEKYMLVPEKSVIAIAGIERIG